MSTPLSSSWSSISADTATAFEDNPASPANELDDGYQSRRLRLKQSLDRITTEGPGISTEIEIPRVVVIEGDSGEPARRIPFGEELFDKEQVCDQIRRAQAAILHPDIDPSDFLGPYKKMRSSGFSMDSILVEISGPKVVDLSFVDLPGVIAMDTEEPENVEKVEQMVKSYVQNVSSLILLVYKCNG
ncbi:hypothetical protein FRC17_002088 [Serendipita sp. 399]|nr:hypothetical protein FRC17_002088 [Serendipita sp. 399]